jgi:hypothetical protein
MVKKNQPKSFGWNYEHLLRLALSSYDVEHIGHAKYIPSNPDQNGRNWRIGADPSPSSSK